MERRNFLIGIGATSAGGSALLGSGAFSSVESDRYVSIEVAEDPDAYLGLDECDSVHGDNYVDIDDDGHIYVDIGENPNGGEGVNSNSRTWFDDVFQVCNQGKDEIDLYVEADDEWPTVDDGEYEGDPRVDFTLGEEEGSIVGADNATGLEVGECACVGIRTNTHGVDATATETLLDDLDDVVTIVASVDELDPAPDPAVFEVSDLEPSEATVEAGDTLDVSATITNTGDEAGEGDVEVSVDDDTLETETLALDPDETETVTFEDVGTDDLDEGEYGLTVSTDDDQESGTLTVEGTDPAVFEVGDLEPSEATVDLGDVIDLSVTVTNTGDEADEGDVEVSVAGETLETETLSLDPDETETVTVEFDTAGLDPDEYAHGASTDDDETTGTITVAYAPLPESVALDPIATDVEMAVGVEFVPDSGLWYVASRFGEITVHDADGSLEEPFLDLSDRITVQTDTGLLGMTLHPEFAENGRLFVRYSAPPREGTPAEYNHTAVLAEFEVNDDRTQASIESERTIMETPNPQDIHSSGDVLFGPDGYLYVPKGDGGFGTPHFAQETGEDADLHGGILRIDVDSEPTEPPQTAPDVDGDDDGGYAIPADNPLVDVDGHRGEYYAWGLRNPWRTSFDGDRYFAGDVGEGTWESVYLVEEGMNLGWNILEGSSCLGGEDCPDEVDDRGGEPLIDPIVEYPRSHMTDDEVYGVCVIGGERYRGSEIPGFGARYVFGDLQVEGRFFVSTPSDGDDLQVEWETEVVAIADEDASLIGQLLSFAVGPDDELYALGDQGVYRIVPAA